VVALKRAADLSRNTDGLFNINQVEFIDDLIDAYEATGRFVEAEKESTYAMRVEEAAYGRNSIKLLNRLDKLALWYENARRYTTELNVYERAYKSRPDLKDLRWRVEHAQHIDPADIPRFGQLGVIAAMQGIHATSDAPYVFARLGPQRAQASAYVWQKLMKTGAVIANGTDVPVERIDPMANFYATVTRKTKDGSVFFGDQKMSREEALKSYTWNGAYAAKEETLMGSLVAGKLADITVLSKDIMTIPEEEIPTTTAVYTIVGGKIAYQR